MRKQVCRWCQGPFETSRAATYCGDVCRQRAHRGYLRCGQCHGPATRLLSVGVARVCSTCALVEWVRADAEHHRDVLDWCRERGVCVYCGDPSDERDHVIPRHVGLATPVVPACGECNRAASGGVFCGLGEKREAIHARLRKRYAKLLRSPEWTTDELDDLGGRLRTWVEGSQYAAAWVRARLAWSIESRKADDC